MYYDYDIDIMPPQGSLTYDPARRTYALQEYEVDMLSHDDLLAADTPRFVIDNDRMADWAARKIRDAKKQRDAAVEHHKRQIEQEKAHCKNIEAYFTSLLEIYFDTLPTRMAKASESYMLPSGKLTRTYAQETMEPDLEALAQWLLDGGYTEYVETSMSAKWGELKKELVIVDGKVINKTTSEVVPVVSVITSPATFKVAPAKEG